MQLSELLGIVVAALGGAAVGVERQWSGHASGPEARFTGVRTFTMLGGLAGLSGWMITAGLSVPAAVLLAGAAVASVVAPSGALRLVNAEDGSRVLKNPNPLQLTAALQMAVLFQLVLLLESAAHEGGQVS